MPVEADLIQKMYVQITLGTPKDRFGYELDEEASELWDRIEREVAAIKAQGLGLEAPPVEVPEIPPWTAEAPEAAATAGGGPAANGRVTLPEAGSREGATVPWSVRNDHPDCDGFGVQNDDTGDLVEGGCHDNQDDAEAHARALYANTPDEEAAAVTTTTTEPEVLGGDPNPGTAADRRLKDNKDRKRRKKSSTAMATASELKTGEGGTFEAILVIEGIPTGDGREFAPDSLTFAELPLQLTYQPPTHGGEPGPAVDVGVIDEVWRDEADPRIIRGRGRFDMADPVAADVYRKVSEGFLRGVSVDVDDIDPYTDIELIWPEVPELETAATDDSDDDGEEGEGAGDLLQLFMPPSKRIFHAGRVRGAAVLSMPAFVQAQLWTEGDGPTLDLAAIEEAARAAEAEAEEQQKERKAVVAAATMTSLAERRPGRDWFTNPRLGQRCPIIVTDDLRVYGHAFQWDQCHIGYSGECVTPPREDDFPYFATGEVLCADGSRVVVGQITLGTGHASTRPGITPRAAAEHYDNTGTVVADVAIGIDRVGAWVAGMIRPGTSPAQIHALRASGQVSGDWRFIGGRLRLVALLAVNVPGFPVPRPEARIAGGQVQALVAAGMLDVGRTGLSEEELDQQALRSLMRRQLADI